MMDVNSLDAFSKTYINTMAQKSANEWVDESCKRLKIERPLSKDLFDNPHLTQSYVLGLVRGGIEEYHRELRANLAEVGINIDDFVENPLIPTKN